MKEEVRGVLMEVGLRGRSRKAGGKQEGRLGTYKCSRQSQPAAALAEKIQTHTR